MPFDHAVKGQIFSFTKIEIAKIKTKKTSSCWIWEYLIAFFLFLYRLRLKFFLITDNRSKPWKNKAHKNTEPCIKAINEFITHQNAIAKYL